MLRGHVPSAYRPVLANRVFQRLILGFAVSYLGDGMSFVAVAWLAIELAPQATAGVWVGGAVAAYTLPGVVGALVFGRRLRRVLARRLLLTDNVVRGVFLGAVPLAWLVGLLTLPLYVVLLAISSLLHAWGSAGKYTLLAGLLPEEQRLAANTLIINLLYGSVEVALPLHVTDDLHAPGTLLGLLDAVRHRRGARRARDRRAAAAAALACDGRHRGRLGLSLLPFGFDVPTAVIVACFTLGGVIYEPFVALSVTLMQAKSPPQYLAAMLAAHSPVLLTASPPGTALGGPLTTALSPRATLGGSGLATVALGAVACVLLLAPAQETSEFVSLARPSQGSRRCVAKQVTRPGQESRSVDPELLLA